MRDALEGEDRALVGMPGAGRDHQAARLAAREAHLHRLARRASAASVRAGGARVAPRPPMPWGRPIRPMTTARRAHATRAALVDDLEARALAAGGRGRAQDHPQRAGDAAAAADDLAEVLLGHVEGDDARVAVALLA